MGFLKTIALIGLTLLSLSTGAAKVRLLTNEVHFITQAGLSTAWLYPLGALQILGAALAAFTKTQSLGLRLIALGLILSGIITLIAGNMLLTIACLIPAALAGGLSMTKDKSA